MPKRMCILRFVVVEKVKKIGDKSAEFMGIKFFIKFL